MADFGISEEIELESCETSYFTVETILKGTPTYMSPEMLNCLKTGSNFCALDPFKADIYSLG